MKVIYYRRKDGTICRFHRALKISDEDLSAAVEKFNAENVNGETACVFDVQPGTIEEYLVKRATEHIELQIATIRDLHSSLQEAESYAYDLLCQAEQEGK